MHNPDDLFSVIKLIEAEDFERALEKTYHLDADGRRRELRQLRQALRLNQKDVALSMTETCRRFL